MKAQLVDSTQPGDWIYEIKFDGYRALALRGGSENSDRLWCLFGKGMVTRTEDSGSFPRNRRSF